MGPQYLIMVPDYRTYLVRTCDNAQKESEAFTNALRITRFFNGLITAGWAVNR